MQFAPVIALGAALGGTLLSTGGATQLRACFTPGQNCESFIVREIEAARQELLVQAYNFTSPPIIEAIARAKDRRVDVAVILDRVNAQKRYTGATYLLNHCIGPLIDDTVAIAHNKVMVIDARTVITGSMNFTNAAQKRNAENVIVIADDPFLADQYRANWNRRAAVSRPFQSPAPDCQQAAGLGQ